MARVQYQGSLLLPPELMMSLTESGVRGTAYSHRLFVGCLESGR